MNFALLMLLGTVFTRLVHHMKNRFKPVSIQAELLDFCITYVIYTCAFLIIVQILRLWN